MILPESMHRHWNVIEPSLLAVSGAAGGTLALLLAPEASTATEYGALFLGFLIFLGMGVLGIAGFTATYIVKAVIKAAADMAGQNAHKLSELDTQDQFDVRFKDIEEASAARADRIVSVLDTITTNLNGLKESVGLLNQEIKHQVARSDELRGAIAKDVATLQEHVFATHQFNRRSTDPS